MKIEDLNKRWQSLKADTEQALTEAIKEHGGAFYFVNDNDERLEEIDDLSELGLPLVDAYTYCQGKQGSFYVTAVVLGDRGLEFYGIDEYHCCDIEDAIRLDYISLGGMLDILENLPNS